MIETVCYYLDDYTDETLPMGLEGPSLDAWAKWLAGGGDMDSGSWTFDPPADGTEFAASRLLFDEDIRVERAMNTEEDDEPVLLFTRGTSPLGPDDIAEYDFVAVRFGPGMGWDTDSILDPSDVESQLADRICPLVEVGDEELLAVAKSEDLRLVYRLDPPRLEILGAVQ